MKTETQKMFREDGSLVQLADYLKLIPKNDWVWSFLWFDGIGTAPNNLSMSQFKKLIKSEPTGFKMNWNQLLEFANSLDQTFDCLLVAVKKIKDLHADELAEDNFSSCEIVIQAFDSSEWKLITRKSEPFTGSDVCFRSH